MDVQQYEGKIIEKASALYLYRNSNRILTFYTLYNQIQWKFHNKQSASIQNIDQQHNRIVHEIWN